MLRFSNLVALGGVVIIVAFASTAAASFLGSSDDTEPPARRIGIGAREVAAPEAEPTGATMTSSMAHHATADPAAEAPPHDPAAYERNLALITGASVRNDSHDRSLHRDTPLQDLVIEDHLGPRQDYLGEVGGNIEMSFPIAEGGQFRAGCEFSHFAYDDPLVAPGHPGGSHLHMFFGNTDVNAHSTYETLSNSGSSTCNGQELNRTGYWVPAMFDAAGNIRVPERVVVYYKGEGRSQGASEPYPPEAAMIATENLNTRSWDRGGAAGKFSFVCSDQWSGTAEPQADTIPVCDGDRFFDLYGVTDRPHVVLEMNVKFPQCWSGDDPANWASSYAVPEIGDWYGSQCPDSHPVNLPNLEYFVNYRVDVGETTDGWYLSSDIDPTTFELAGEPGHSTHGDWWGGWHPEINQTWIDECVNVRAEPVSGCGFGYLSDGGPDPQNPFDGPALAVRPQYEGPHKVPFTLVYGELCQPHTDRVATQPQEAAHCVVGDDQ
ncbi:MAG: DUF1996 domain-containing protein [Actinomycetota bacterium]